MPWGSRRGEDLSLRRADQSEVGEGPADGETGDEFNVALLAIHCLTYRP